MNLLHLELIKWLDEERHEEFIHLPYPFVGEIKIPGLGVRKLGF
jgi:hypothetical protein